MSLVYKLGFIGLSTVGAGASLPFIVQSFHIAYPSANNKYIWQSPSSPLFTSIDTELGTKVLLELDTEHEKAVKECRSCDKFRRRFKLKVVDKSGQKGNFDRMMIFPDGTMRIVGEDYKEGKGRRVNDVELEQKLRKVERLEEGDHILINLKDISLGTSDCKWSDKTIECELDILGWERLKLGDTTKPKMIFYAQY